MRARSIVLLTTAGGLVPIHVTETVDEAWSGYLSARDAESAMHLTDPSGERIYIPNAMLTAVAVIGPEPPSQGGQQITAARLVPVTGPPTRRTN